MGYVREIGEMKAHRHPMMQMDPPLRDSLVDIPVALEAGRRVLLSRSVISAQTTLVAQSWHHRWCLNDHFECLHDKIRRLWNRLSHFFKAIEEKLFVALECGSVETL